MNPTKLLPTLALIALPAALSAQELAPLRPDAPLPRLPLSAAPDSESKQQSAPKSKDELFGATDDEPKSKDALFGTTKEAEPASKEALFGGTDEKPAIKWFGSVDALGAYTYSDPAHWSRGVGRLTLGAQGAFSEDVRWKLSGRVDGDIVYATSNFYLPAVKDNQQLTAIWGENYLDVSAGSWDFRLGAQQIIWGEVMGLFFADVVSARDLREFLLPSFDLIRIPQLAARAEYSAGDAHLELIWIPVPAFDRIGKPGSDFYPVPLPSPTPAAVAALFQDPVRPSRSLDNSNYGVRVNGLISGWDLSAFYYRSFSSSPTFYRLEGTAPGQPIVFQPRYDRIWQAGGTVTQDFRDFVLRGEAVYTSGAGYGVTDLTAPQGVVKRDTLDYILSFEFPLPSEVRLNVQAFQRYYFGGEDSIAIKSQGFGASVFLSGKITSSLEPQILWIQNFNGAGGLVRPRLNWYAAKNTVLGFGVDVFTGPDDGYFGRYNNRDRVYSELRFDF